LPTFLKPRFFREENQQNHTGSHIRVHEPVSVKGRLRTRGKMQTKGKTQTRGKMQNKDYRLQTKGKTREKTAGNTSVLVKVRRNLLKSI